MFSLRPQPSWPPASVSHGSYYEHVLSPDWSLVVLDTTEVGVNGAGDAHIAEAHSFLAGRPQWQAKALAANGGVSTAQLQWLRSRLEVARRHSSRRVLVAGHMPLLSAASRPNGYTRVFNWSAVAGDAHTDYSPRMIVHMITCS